jgi:hypothetical protein
LRVILATACLQLGICLNGFYVNLVLPLQRDLITIRRSLLENGLRVSDVDASGRRYILVKDVDISVV